MSTIKAELFHPMQGHVSEGNKIKFDSGKILTITNRGIGWELFNNDVPTGIAFEGAYDLASWIDKNLNY